MKMQVEWKGKMAFEGKSESGTDLLLDASSIAGGEGKGQTPMEAVLTALGGCTGIDVVSILNKMRVEIDTFNLEIEAERAENHPKVFTKINVHYSLTGKDLDEIKVRKAINLTQDKYCSVSNSLKADVTYTFAINGIQYK